VLHISGQLNADATEVNAVDEGIAPAFIGANFKADRLARKADPKLKRDRSGFGVILKKERKKDDKSFKFKLAHCKDSELCSLRDTQS
jgi:hypothetical protein